MSNYNKVLLMGRLTRDPEIRYTQGGIPVTEIGLAVNREYTVGTERRKETTFVDITLWRRQAEVVCQYLKKGQPIFIEGKLALDSWETQDGQKRTKLKVVADNFQFLGSRGEAEAPQGDASEESGGYYGPGQGQGGQGQGGQGQGGLGYGGGGPGRTYGDEGGSQGGAPGGAGQGRRWGGGQGGRAAAPAPGAGPPTVSPAPQPPPPGEEGPLDVGENDVPF